LEKFTEGIYLEFTKKRSSCAK